MLTVKPMLAYKAGVRPIDFSEQVFIQPKLDGVRCLFTKDGAFSRTGKQFMNVAHIESQLKEFFNLNPDIVLDGELYNHQLKNDFEKIISLVRKQKPTDNDRNEAADMINYHVYDFISDTPASYMVRGEVLNTWHNILGWDSTNVYLLTTIPIKDQDAARAIHEANLADGYEGSIIRLNKPYEQKRSYNLQKFKDFSDKEATIIGFVPGKGKRTGTLGKFIMRDENGVEFGCPPGKGYTHADLREILENITYFIGQQATFTYFERTKAGSYRHPQFKTLRNYE